MNVVFFGTSPFGIPCLETLAAGRHRLAAVVSTPDRPQGRNLDLQPSPVKRWAVSKGIEVVDYDPARRPDVRERLSRVSPDLFVVASFGYLIGPEFLDLPTRLTLNVHPSLLPRYRGASPIQRALWDGLQGTGVTLIRMNEALDEGDIAAQEEEPIAETDTALTLELRLAERSARMLGEAIERLEAGRLEFRPQDHASATYAPKIRKEDGVVDWTRSSRQIACQVRALAGWPVASCRLEGRRLLLHEARALPAAAAGEPGRVLAADPKTGRLEVACGEGTLAIDRLQLEGRKSLPAREFLVGCPLSRAARLE